MGVNYTLEDYLIQLKKEIKELSWSSILIHWTALCLIGNVASDEPYEVDQSLQRLYKEVTIEKHPSLKEFDTKKFDELFTKLKIFSVFLFAIALVLACKNL